MKRRRYHRTKRQAEHYWRKHVRIAVLERDNFECKKCGSKRSLEVDHIVPIEHKGAMFDLRNLQTLCKICHTNKTIYQNRKYNNTGADEWIHYRERAKMQTLIGVTQ